MKRYRFIFNVQTLLVLSIALLSSYLSIRFQLKMYIDFIFIGIFIAIPLTFSLRVAFKRRERAMEYLSTFNAALQSSYDHFEISKQGLDKKNEFKHILINISDELLQYLSGKTRIASAVQKASGAVFNYLEANKENFKGSFSQKILSFQLRINESIDFLLATKHHRTPWGIRAGILVAIYLFVIFYPAALLNDIGFDVALWYVFVMTGLKGLIVISFWNVQNLIEDPFNLNSPDSVRLYDFRCLFMDEPDAVPAIITDEKPSLKTKTDSDENDEEDE